MFAEIMPFAKKFYTVTPDSVRAMKAEELAKYLKSAGAEAVSADAGRKDRAEEDSVETYKGSR